MNKITFEINLAFKTFVRSFFSVVNNGDECVICGKKAFLVPLCENCKNEFFSTAEILTKTRCLVCGKVLISERELCSECRKNPVLHHADKVIPLFPYRLWNRELLYLWKHSNVRTLSEFFAECVADVLRKLCIEVIVPVPPRDGKIQKKGWDQIEELCEFLEYRFGFKIFRILERKSTGEQKKLDKVGRLQSIGHAYCVLSDKKEYLKVMKSFSEILPSSVCLLDDVLTTGSTLETCAAVLKKTGIRNITALTLFNVD